MVEALFLTVFPLCVVYAGVSDMLTMKIPNRVSIVLVAGFVLLAPLSKLGWDQIGWHLIGALLVFVVAFILFALNFVGGGDAKLLPAVVLWMGPELSIPYVLLVAMLGGLLAMGLLYMRGGLMPPILHRCDWIMRLHRAKGDMPYGIPLAAAGLSLYLQTPIVQSLFQGAGS